MHGSRLLPALIGMAILATAPAQAWHRGGHMTVARIAWLELEQNQPLRAQYSAILKSHPHYQIYLAAERAPGVDEDEWVWLRAATWSDWVRDPRAPGLSKEDAEQIRKQFHKDLWHFVNLPYVHPQDTGEFDADAIRQAALMPELDGKGEPRHGLAAIKQCLATLRSSDAPMPDRAVCLCWLLHVVGDLHQPLHCATLIASKERFGVPFLPPDGDRGGNRLAIRLNKNDPSAVDVHSFWDAQLFITDPAVVTEQGLEEMTPTYKKVAETAAELRNAPGLQRDQLAGVKVADTRAWADESFKIAQDSAYRDGDGFVKAVLVPPGKHPLVNLTAPELSAAYRDSAKSIARQRIALAGYRLADQLRVALKNE
jgi:hypothetical protein